MKIFIKSVQKKSHKIYNEIRTDIKLCSDLCETNTHLPSPFSEAEATGKIKLIIVGQDPTVREAETREKITTVLMLNEKRQLNKFINLIAVGTGITFNEIYATNLYKCFFKEPPQKDERVLTRHFRYWIELLIEEVKKFPDAAVITLGQPVLKQLVHTGSKDVKYYWDYRGDTKSGGSYKSVPAENNFLNRIIYPVAHLPTYNRNAFYRNYFEEYLRFVKGDVS